MTCFKQHDIMIALRCAGNRRHTMCTLLKEIHAVVGFLNSIECERLGRCPRPLSNLKTKRKIVSSLKLRIVGGILSHSPSLKY